MSVYEDDLFQTWIFPKSRFHAKAWHVHGNIADLEYFQIRSLPNFRFNISVNSYFQTCSSGHGKSAHRLIGWHTCSMHAVLLNYKVPANYHYLLCRLETERIMILSVILALLAFPPCVFGTRDALVEHYFHHGYDYGLILCFLHFLHGISISLRQLKRRLGLRRRTLQDRTLLIDTVEVGYQV